jgi:hypothetical protein
MRAWRDYLFGLVEVALCVPMLIVCLTTQTDDLGGTVTATTMTLVLAVTAYDGVHRSWFAW